MNRDWLTLAFGIALVGAVVALSLRQNMISPADSVPPPAAAPATTPSSAEAAPAPAEAPAQDPAPAAERPEPPARAPAPNRAPAAPAPAAEAPSPPPVRLNASIPVVHRHGMGSCQGMLAATAKGLSYDTTNKGDAFAVGFGEIDQFEVDYQKKNLRVKRRAGRTWNFTNESADALFVFHREVSKARERAGR